MITINVFLQVKPEKRTDYLAFIVELVNASQQDEGCLFYAHFEKVDQSNQFIIVENWQNSSAVEKHNETPHLKNFMNEASFYLEKEAVIKVSRSE
ncbi:antibiotic biosynthesis monooxygenase [Enterococcus ureasiticus]|uniref:putative quinol monooxygenase n=1 Tax=Enterococcus ureasiticus TaxID=903984 RepID=UPI001A8D75D4|nr:putative quinol monooxygenase [Enterococcus ureasiticus]MBO0472421.1 antibiotic biosynthesis monooxygenase [Enterococcus ureasiticus]